MTTKVFDTGERITVEVGVGMGDDSIAVIHVGFGNREADDEGRFSFTREEAQSLVGGLQRGLSEVERQKQARPDPR